MFKNFTNDFDNTVINNSNIFNVFNDNFLTSYDKLKKDYFESLNKNIPKYQKNTFFTNYSFFFLTFVLLKKNFFFSNFYKFNFFFRFYFLENQVLKFLTKHEVVSNDLSNFNFVKKKQTYDVSLVNKFLYNFDNSEMLFKLKFFLGNSWIKKSLYYFDKEKSGFSLNSWENLFWNKFFNSFFCVFNQPHTINQHKNVCYTVNSKNMFDNSTDYVILDSIYLNYGFLVQKNLNFNYDLFFPEVRVFDFWKRFSLSLELLKTYLVFFSESYFNFFSFFHFLLENRFTVFSNNFKYIFNSLDFFFKKSFNIFYKKVKVKSNFNSNLFLFKYKNLFNSFFDDVKKKFFLKILLEKVFFKYFTFFVTTTIVDNFNIIFNEDNINEDNLTVSYNVDLDSFVYFRENQFLIKKKHDKFFFAEFIDDGFLYTDVVKPFKYQENVLYDLQSLFFDKLVLDEREREPVFFLKKKHQFLLQQFLEPEFVNIVLDNTLLFLKKSSLNFAKKVFVGDNLQIIDVDLFCLDSIYDDLKNIVFLERKKVFRSRFNFKKGLTVLKKSRKTFYKQHLKSSLSCLAIKLNLFKIDFDFISFFEINFFFVDLITLFYSKDNFFYDFCSKFVFDYFYYVFDSNLFFDFDVLSFFLLKHLKADSFFFNFDFIDIFVEMSLIFKQKFDFFLFDNTFKLGKSINFFFDNLKKINKLSFFNSLSDYSFYSLSLFLSKHEAVFYNTDFCFFQLYKPLSNNDLYQCQFLFNNEDLCYDNYMDSLFSAFSVPKSGLNLDDFFYYPVFKNSMSNFYETFWVDDHVRTNTYLGKLTAKNRKGKPDMFLDVFFQFDNFDLSRGTYGYYDFDNDLDFFNKNLIFGDFTFWLYFKFFISFNTKYVLDTNNYNKLINYTFKDMSHNEVFDMYFNYRFFSEYSFFEKNDLDFFFELSNLSFSFLLDTTFNLENLNLIKSFKNLVSRNKLTFNKLNLLNNLEFLNLINSVLLKLDRTSSKIENNNIQMFFDNLEYDFDDTVDSNLFYGLRGLDKFKYFLTLFKNHYDFFNDNDLLLDLENYAPFKDNSFSTLKDFVLNSFKEKIVFVTDDLFNDVSSNIYNRLFNFYYNLWCYKSSLDQTRKVYIYFHYPWTFLINYFYNLLNYSTLLQMEDVIFFPTDVRFSSQLVLGYTSASTNISDNINYFQDFFFFNKKRLPPFYVNSILKTLADFSNQFEADFQKRFELFSTHFLCFWNDSHFFNFPIIRYSYHVFVLQKITLLEKSYNFDFYKSLNVFEFNLVDNYRYNFVESRLDFVSFDYIDLILKNDGYLKNESIEDVDEFSFRSTVITTAAVGFVNLLKKFSFKPPFRTPSSWRANLYSIVMNPNNNFDLHSQITKDIYKIGRFFFFDFDTTKKFFFDFFDLKGDNFFFQNMFSFDFIKKNNLFLISTFLGNFDFKDYYSADTEKLNHIYDVNKFSFDFFLGLLNCSFSKLYSKNLNYIPLTLVNKNEISLQILKDDVKVSPVFLDASNDLFKTSNQPFLVTYWTEDDYIEYNLNLFLDKSLYDNIQIDFYSSNINSLFFKRKFINISFENFVLSNSAFTNSCLDLSFFYVFYYLYKIFPFNIEMQYIKYINSLFYNDFFFFFNLLDSGIDFQQFNFFFLSSVTFFKEKSPYNFFFYDFKTTSSLFLLDGNLSFLREQELVKLCDMLLLKDKTFDLKFDNYTKKGYSPLKLNFLFFNGPFFFRFFSFLLFRFNFFNFDRNYFFTVNDFAKCLPFFLVEKTEKYLNVSYNDFFSFFNFDYNNFFFSFFKEDLNYKFFDNLLWSTDFNRCNSLDINLLLNKNNYILEFNSWGVFNYFENLEYIEPKVFKDYLKSYFFESFNCCYEKNMSFYINFHIIDFIGLDITTKANDFYTASLERLLIIPPKFWEILDEDRELIRDVKDDFLINLFDNNFLLKRLIKNVGSLDKDKVDSYVYYVKDKVFTNLILSYRTKFNQPSTPNIFRSPFNDICKNLVSFDYDNTKFNHNFSQNIDFEKYSVYSSQEYLDWFSLRSNNVNDMLSNEALHYNILSVNILLQKTLYIMIFSNFSNNFLLSSLLTDSVFYENYDFVSFIKSKFFFNDFYMNDIFFDMTFFDFILFQQFFFSILNYKLFPIFEIFSNFLFSFFLVNAIVCTIKDFNLSFFLFNYYSYFVYIKNIYNFYFLLFLQNKRLTFFNFFEFKKFKKVNLLLEKKNIRNIFNKKDLVAKIFDRKIIKNIFTRKNLFFLFKIFLVIFFVSAKFLVF